MICVNAYASLSANYAIHIPFLEDVMPACYFIKSLLQDNAAKAYPIIRTAYPHVSLDDWLTYFAWISQPAEKRQFSAGIVSVEDERGYIQGLFSYVTGFGLGRGTVLNVEHFVAMDSGDRAAAIGCLIEAMEDVAHNYGCVSIHTQIPEHWANVTTGKYGIPAHLSDAGHDRETVRFSKFLRPG